MQIEKMCENDVDEVYNISVEEFKTNSWSKKLFLKELDDNKFKNSYVIKQNDKIVGFLNLCFNDEEMTILNLAIKNQFKRRGYATNLIEKAINLAKEKNLKQMFLEVESTNIPAKNLYAKFGFVVLKIRKNYYANHSDAIEMIKYLN